MQSQNRNHRKERSAVRGRSTLAALALAGLAACSSTPDVYEPAPAPGVGAAIDQLAFELAQKASTRVDLSSLRVVLQNVDDIDGKGFTPLPSRFASTDLSVLTEEVEGEVTMALASNFHLIDRELVAPLEKSWQKEGLSAAEIIERTGATHIVIGTVSPHEYSVQLNLRLVDARNYVIVAAARTELPIQLLSDRSRVALGDLLPPRGRALPSRRSYESTTQPPEPVPVTDRGVALAEPLVSDDYPIRPAGYSYAPTTRTRKAATPDREGPAAARFAALNRHYDN